MTFGLTAIYEIAFMMAVGALIGWLTNRIAIWMLFHPQQPVGPPFLRLHGVLPKRQSDVARAVARVITHQLLTRQDQALLLRSIEIRQHLEPVMDDLVVKAINENIPSRILALPKVRETMATVLQSAVRRCLPDNLGDLPQDKIEKFLNEFDIEAHIRQRIESFDLDRLEQIVRQIANRELMAIEVWGGVLGLLLGLGQGLFLLVWK